MKFPGLKLYLLSLFALLFAGYQIACACSHDVPAAGQNVTSHHGDTTSQVMPCHAEAPAEVDPAHACPRYPDLIDAATSVLNKAEPTKRLSEYSVQTAPRIARQTLSMRWLTRLQHPPPLRSRPEHLSPVSLKVRLLN